MQAFVALIPGLFGVGMFWYARRSWQKFTSAGELRVDARGWVLHFRRAWSVRCFLALFVFYGLAGLGIAVAIVVTALR